MSVFEMMMLISFGSAWPFSIYKSLRSKSTKGKSVNFLLIVLVGYACGITHKILYSMDAVIWFYALNMLMVMADAVIYFRNRRMEKINVRQS